MPPVPNATVLESVPENVKVLTTASVLPSVIVNVALLVGAVIFNLLILVAVATPNTGVTNVGDVNVAPVPNTRAPVPVSSAITEASSEDVVAANTLNLLEV